MSQRVSDEQIKHLLKAVKDGDFLGTYEAKLVLADLEEARAARLDVRPEVAAFALAMEERLRANDHKGGWQDDDLPSLHSRFNEESYEFSCARLDFQDGIASGEKLRHEAADVANFLMMILDVAGALAATEKKS